MVSGPSIGTVDVDLFQLAYFPVGRANLEYVGLVPIGAMTGGERYLLLADLVLCGLLVFFLFDLRLSLALQDAESFVTPQTALTLGVLAALALDYIHLLFLGRSTEEVLKNELLD